MPDQAITKASWVLEANRNSKAKIILNEGSSRSTKTYSIIQCIILSAGETPGIYSVVRKTLPALKSSAYRDFLEILKNSHIYDPAKHNKSELIYKIKQSEVEFFSIDQWEKVKGRKRRDLFVNEANELTYDDFIQLALRTTGRIYMDYNPSHDKFHWIETKIKTRNDVEVIHSTYNDNPFLEESVKREIERLKETDENLWRIYGEGRMGVLKNLVFSNWKLCDELPEGERIYWLDFGFNNPTSLGEISIRDDDVYCDEIIYERYLNNTDLIAKMKALGINETIKIYADSEDPGRINEIQQAGFNAEGTKKGKDSVSKGIDIMRSRMIYITKRSVNTHKEFRGYKYVEKNGEPTDEPVKFNDHSIDGIRGALYTHINRPMPGVTWV